MNAGQWVRDAEKRRGGTPDQQLYKEDYENLRDIIDKNYASNPNDSIDTNTVSKFESQLTQIEKDIDRTLNNDPYFGEGKEGRENLRTLLKILALKYTDIGYVQGMNFLVASFLYHSSPEITLFLITVLIEDYELCDIYREDVQGLHLRNNIIKQQVETQIPDLNEHFMEIGIDPQMFTTEWVLDLLSHIIPLDLYRLFMDHFISDGNPKKVQLKGWNFFYRLVITILSSIKGEILKRYEWDEVLVFIRNYVKEKDSGINWAKIIDKAGRN